MAKRVAAAKQPVASGENWPLDPVVLVSFGLLLIIGFVMVASASTEISARTYGTPFYLLIKHGVYVSIAVLAAGMTLNLPVGFWQQVDWMLLVMSFVLLGLVLVPGIGREVNGSTRWISLGFFTLQGSEFVKLFVVVYLAGYLSRRREEIQVHLSGFAKPLALVLLLVALLLQQPDFGAAVVIMATVMGMIFLAGVRLVHYVPIIAAFVAAAGAVAVLQPYRLERLQAFVDPWGHQFQGGYQLTQALIAFGRGEWFGLGLGNSIQKLFFLPEAHTDFVFSILAEELGVIGAVLVIALFLCLIVRGMWIGRVAETRGHYFSGYLAYGISLILGIQAAVNIGVNIGLLPTKGLTLPFISYGGNSLIVSCMLVAILLRVEYESRREGELIPAARKRGGASRGR
jgi:cell division protein FtsW